MPAVVAPILTTLPFNTEFYLSDLISSGEFTPVHVLFAVWSLILRPAIIAICCALSPVKDYNQSVYTSWWNEYFKIPISHGDHSSWRLAERWHHVTNPVNERVFIGWVVNRKFHKLAPDVKLDDCHWMTTFQQVSSSLDLKIRNFDKRRWEGGTENRNLCSVSRVSEVFLSPVGHTLGATQDRKHESRSHSIIHLILIAWARDEPVRD